MTSGEIVPREWPTAHGGRTYGCLEPVEITPLEALVDDVKRTQAHILWLEAYIAAMPGESLFTDMEFDLAQELERTRIGKPTIVGSVRWQMEINRRKQTKTSRTRAAVHPAVRMLLEERKHLADVSARAIAVGIKLDSVDYSRAQADMIVGAMAKFALESGLNPNDPTISQRIVDAMEFVIHDNGDG